MLRRVSGLHDALSGYGRCELTQTIPQLRIVPECIHDGAIPQRRFRVTDAGVVLFVYRMMNYRSSH